MKQNTEIIKYEGDNSTFIWKHPCEDFNSLTQLIVHESQEAIFFLNGKALDLFGPGRYTLETQNIPLLGKFTNRPTGGESPFHCEVYFINKTVQMDIKWGTDSKVRYVEPQFGIPLEIGASGELNLMVSDSRRLLVSLVGTMNGISWSSENNNFTKSLQNSFRPMISTAVKSNLSKAIKAKNINILEVDEHLTELSVLLRESIVPGFEEYGLTVPQFFLTSVVLPESDPNFKKIRDLHTIAIQKKVAEAESEIRTAQIKAEADVKTIKAQTDTEVLEAQREVELAKQATEIEVAKRVAEKRIIDSQAEAQARAIEAQGEAEALRATGYAEAQVMREKGYTEKDVLQADVQKEFAKGLGEMGSNGGGNSAMGDILGLGIGLQAAGAMGSQVNNMFSGFAQQSSSLNNPSNVSNVSFAETQSCPSCGESVPVNSKFCLNCGNKIIKLEVNEIVCPDCGSKIQKGKFCMICGAQLEKKCSNCGSDIPAGGKFCLECGQKV